MADQAAPPHAAPAAPPLVGRGRELATLRDALAAALAGCGSLVLIGGEAGIGKTALAEALCAEATTQGALVFVGPCYDLAETPPYGPWAEALDRWPAIPDFPPRPALLGVADAAGVAETQAMRFARLRGALLAAAARRPLVLVLEDLHWADPASLELLRFLARGLADAAILLIGTYRAEDLRRGHPLYALLPALVREARAARLDLRPLGDDDLRALVRVRHALTAWDEARLVAYLGERTGGNPLFAGELLRALAEEGVLRPVPADSADGGDGAGWALGGLAGVPVPALLRQVIDARVARLGEGSYRLLGLAATIGQEVPLALWRAAGAGDAAALAAVVERALAAGVLAEASDSRGVRFAHALIREALYAGVPLPRRERLHGRIGDALLAGASPDPDAVAYHLRQAGDSRAAAWLIRAGERAQRAHATLTAAERYEAALALLAEGGADDRERGWILFRLYRTRQHTDPERAEAHLREAAGRAARDGDAALAVRTSFSIGLRRVFAGQFRAGIAAMEASVAAMAALAPDDMARLRARSAAAGMAHDRGVLVVLLALAGHLRRSVALGEDARAAAPVAADGDDAQAEDDVQNGLALAYAILGRPDQARRAAARAIATYRACGDRRAASMVALRQLASEALPYRADDPQGRHELAAAALGDALAGGMPVAAASLVRLPLLLVAGAWGEAHDLAAVAAALAAGWRVHTHAVLGTLALARGDLAGAWAVVRERLPAGPDEAPGDTELLPALAAQRLAAALALDAGDPATARAWLAAHDRWLAWSGAVLGQAEGQLGWAAHHRAAGDHALARQHGERALARAAAPRQPLAHLAAHRFLGELATDDGRHADAARHLATALALAEACAAPYERALTLLALAELRAAADHSGEAAHFPAEARATLEALEAAPALARADALAARLAAAPPPAPPALTAYPAGLSAREVEVLRLVAAGLTNPQVAARLSLSPRTVGQHLRAIYAKLDVTTRTAAARIAQDHDLL